MPWGPAQYTRAPSPERCSPQGQEQRVQAEVSGTNLPHACAKVQLTHKPVLSKWGGEMGSGMGRAWVLEKALQPGL